MVINLESDYIQSLDQLLEETIFVTIIVLVSSATKALPLPILKRKNSKMLSIRIFKNFNLEKMWIGIILLSTGMNGSKDKPRQLHQYWTSAQ